MKVWVLEVGEYSDRVVYGVYYSLDDAKASVPWATQWTDEGSCSNGGDWFFCGQKSCASIVSHLVEGEAR